MRSEHSKSPQTHKPDALIQSRKAVAFQNYEAVRVAVQALRRRGTPANEITIKAVAREAGVSGATIYRRDDLFRLIQKANAHLERRQAVQMYRNDLTDLRVTLAKVQEDAAYYKQEAEVAKIGSHGLRQEITQLRKQNLDLQRKISQLEDERLQCTCGKDRLSALSLVME